MLAPIRNLLLKLNRPLPPAIETLTIGLVVGAALFISCPSAFAKNDGGGPGNGGDAIMINGKWTLLDLAEAGITTSDRYSKHLTKFRKYSKELFHVRGLINKVFVDSRFTPDFKEGLGAMITYSGNEKVAFLAVMQLYKWELTEAKLMQIGDEQSTLDLSQYEVEQLAVRRDDRIQIHAPIFLKMDTQNQVALILHEMAYALTTPRKDKDGNLYQPSWKARSYVATIFGNRNISGKMAYQMYGDGTYVFEANNNVIGITATYTNYGTEELAFEGSPVLVVSEKPLTIQYSYNGTLQPRYPDGMADVLHPAWTCEGRCSILEDYNIFGAHLRFTDDYGDSHSSDIRYADLCREAKTGELHLSIISRVVNWGLIPLETEKGTTMRPTVYESTPTLIGIDTFSTEPTEDCMKRIKSGVAKGNQKISDKLETLRLIYDR